MNNVFKQIKRTFAVLSALSITVVSSKIRGHHPFESCSRQQFNQCAKPLTVLTDSGLTFAASKPDLDRMCPDLHSALRCIYGYSRHCMTREEHAHFRQLLNGTRLMVQDLCENATYQQEFLQYAPCMKKVEKQNEICFKTYDHAMKEIELKTKKEESTMEPDLVSYKKRKREVADEGIKSVCCVFQHYVECSTHTMRRACGEDAAEFGRQFLDKMSSSLIRLHCSDYGRSVCGLASSGESQMLSGLVLSIIPILAYFR